MKTRTSRAKMDALKDAVHTFTFGKDTEVDYLERIEHGEVVGSWIIKTHTYKMDLFEAKVAAADLEDAIALVQNIEEWELEEVEKGTDADYSATRDAILEVMDEGDWAGIWSYMRI